MRGNYTVEELVDYDYRPRGEEIRPWTHAYALCMAALSLFMALLGRDS